MGSKSELLRALIAAFKARPVLAKRFELLTSGFGGLCRVRVSNCIGLRLLLRVNGLNHSRGRAPGLATQLRG